MKIDSLNTYSKQSFRARVYETVICNIFEYELRPKLRNAKNDKERKDVLELAEKVYKKTKEISFWDNNRVKIGLVYSQEAKASGLGIMIDNTFSECEDKMFVSPEQIKKNGWTKSFLNLKKEDYLKIRKPYITELAKKAFLHSYDLGDIRKKIGKDSYKIFIEEFSKINTTKTDDFDERIKKKLEIIG